MSTEDVAKQGAMLGALWCAVGGLRAASYRPGSLECWRLSLSGSLGSVVPQSLPQGQLLCTCLVDMLPLSLTQAREHLILCEHLVLYMLPVVLPQVHREAWPTQRSTFRTYTLTLAVS